WRLYQIPLAGGGPWTVTSICCAMLTDVLQIEIHQPIFGTGTFYYDGVGFGSLAPGLTIDPARVVGGVAATAVVTLSFPAPPGGAVIPLTSSNTSVATVPSSVAVAAGATSAM